MKIFVHEESGCAYRVDEENEVEWLPLTKDNVIDTDDFGTVELEHVSEEIILHNGNSITIGDFQAVIRAQLA